MASDELRELIARARYAMPEIPEQAWIRFEAIVREASGGTRIYIRANRKTRHFERLASLDGTGMREIDRSIEMGISDRRLRQLPRPVPLTWEAETNAYQIAGCILVDPDSHRLPSREAVHICRLTVPCKRIDV